MSELGKPVETFLARVPFRNLTGSESLPAVPKMAVSDYWRWAHADILENVQRGIFAEFLVAAALGITHQRREGWSGYDLNYGNYAIEVKSSAYLQAWPQKVLSKISFGIGPKIQFDPEADLGTNLDPRYVAHCFVFCVFADTDPLTADVLDASRWRFYVVPIFRLIEFCKTAKSIVESRVKQITSAVNYSELKERIDATRAGDLFPAPFAAASAATGSDVKGVLKTYAVWERGTRLHPVLVKAANANDAFLLSRADPTLAALGTAIAGKALTKAEVDDLKARGAVDLRT
jgi:hypothetical protein